jgi:DNA-binding LacI/PurR family transcriptional regulator
VSATPSIGIDGYAAARQITAHLVSIGHRRIGCARIAADLIIQLEPRRNGWPDRIRRHLLDHESVIRNSTARPTRL